MPSLNTIFNWFRYSQIEYFTPFMKLWLAFNSWYRQLLPSIGTDRDAINSLKTSSPIKANFERIIDSAGDEGKEIRGALSILVKEIRIQKLVNESGVDIGFDQSDIEPDFRDFSEKAKKQKLNSGNFIKLDEETVVISDKSTLFHETLEVIYRVRCHLIHGNFDVEDRRAHRLVKSSFVILNKIFAPIISSA